MEEITGHAVQMVEACMKDETCLVNAVKVFTAVENAHNGKGEL